MSAAVEVHLVPDLDPLPRAELPPVAALTTVPHVGAVARAGTASGTGAVPAPVTARLAADGAVIDAGAPPARAAARASGTSSARPAPAGRAASPEPPPGACQPVVERLGAGRLAAYSHVPPERPAAATAVAVPLLPSAAPAGGSPSLDPRQACCMVALAAVEVLAGTRPLAQLARWVTPEVYDALARRAALTAPRTRVLDPTAAPADLDGGDAPPVRRPSVRRVRACVVGPHSLEASVVVAHAGRVRAVAVRLTRSTGRWRASALVVG